MNRKIKIRLIIFALMLFFVPPLVLLLYFFVAGARFIPIAPPFISDHSMVFIGVVLFFVLHGRNAQGVIKISGFSAVFSRVFAPPIFAIGLTGILFFLLSGVFVFWTDVFGERLTNVEGLITKFGDYHAYAKGECHQSGTISVLSLNATLCLEDITNKKVVHSGKVLFDLKRSSYGVIIKSVNLLD